MVLPAPIVNSINGARQKQMQSRLEEKEKEIKKEKETVDLVDKPAQPPLVKITPVKAVPP